MSPFPVVHRSASAGSGPRSEQQSGLFLRPMSACPLCDHQSLQDAQIEGVSIQSCPRCHGLWLGAGKLARFEGRPSATAFLPLASHAPGRCRGAGHAISRAYVRCDRCGSAPALCPDCGDRLSQIPTQTCTIDVCASCGGVWLDKGELQRLRAPAIQPPSKPGAPERAPAGWEIPAPASSAVDPWLAPGQSQQSEGVRNPPDVRAPLSCRHCGAKLGVRQAWAYDGDIYCGACHPPGAVSSNELPDAEPASPQAAVDWGERLLQFLSRLARHPAG